MSEPFVTIATFPTVAEAQLARNLLDEQDLPAFLADMETAGMAWQDNSTFGGVKLQVAAEDERRAHMILARRSREYDEPLVDDYGFGESRATSIRRARHHEAYPEDEEEEEEVPESPADATARRAWRSAVIGLLIFPPLLHFYSVGLLLQLLGASDPLSDKGKRWLCAAVAVDALGFAFGAVMWNALFWVLI